MKKKTIALVMAVVLLMVATVGGTLAWLTAESGPVTNTFTTSDITVTLTETKTDFKMIPGYTIEKDPVAAVSEGSVDCWLFVKIEEKNNLASYISYTVASGWEAVEGATGVYARKVKASDTAKSFSVLADNKVTVLGSVTKEMMTTAETTQPQLVITAYASQLYKDGSTEFTAAQAWANVSNPSGTTSAE